MILALLMLLLSAARADDEWGGYLIPNLAYDSDDGLGFGARGELQRRELGYSPYKSAYVIHAYATLRGFHHHRLRYDRVGLGPNHRLRFTAHLAWRQWTNDGYWGVGPGATREYAYAGDFDKDDPARKRYRYTLIQPFMHLTLRETLSGPWSIYGSFDARYSVVRTYPGSLLEEQAPYGMHGGLTLQGTAGVLYDTRSPEIDPARGMLAELSGRYAPPVPMGAGQFGGVFVSFRQFVTLGERSVFAYRVMGEMLWGEIPFYEMVHWGGFVPIAGYGGADTLRGVAFGRYRAPGKAVLNTELRVDTLSHSLRGAPMVWQLVPYVDVGRVFGAGELATAADPAGWGLNPAAGLGLRAVYDEAFVGRIDVGVAPDPVEGLDGAVHGTPRVGFYFVFDHMF